MAVRFTQRLGWGLVRALGLDQSGMGPGLLAEISDRFDHLFDFTLTVSTMPGVPCAGGGHGTVPEPPREEHAHGKEGRKNRPGIPVAPVKGRCCRMILNPARDAWTVPSPQVHGRDSETVAVTVGIRNGSLKITGTATTTPTITGVSLEGDCPGRCEDERLRIDVSVLFEVELTLELSYTVQDYFGGAPAPLDFGPVLGVIPGQNGFMSWTYTFAVSRRLQRNLTYAYVADCDGIRPDEAADTATSGTVPGATPSGSFVPDTEVTYVPAAAHCPTPDGAAMVQSRQLRALIERLWDNSNPNAPDAPRGSPSQKLEQGGWVIFNAQTGAYRVERRQALSRDRISLLPLPQVSYPECVWARVHTHPNRAQEGYYEGWSAEDRAIHERWRDQNNRRIPDLMRSHRGLHALYDDPQGNPVEVTP